MCGWPDTPTPSLSHTLTIHHTDIRIRGKRTSRDWVAAFSNALPRRKHGYENTVYGSCSAAAAFYWLVRLCTSWNRLEQGSPHPTGGCDNEKGELRAKCASLSTLLSTQPPAPTLALTPTATQQKSTTGLQLRKRKHTLGPAPL